MSSGILYRRPDKINAAPKKKGGIMSFADRAIKTIDPGIDVRVAFIAVVALVFGAIGALIYAAVKHL